VRRAGGAVLGRLLSSWAEPADLDDTPRIRRHDLRTAAVTLVIGLSLNLLGLERLYSDLRVWEPTVDDSLWFALLLLAGCAIICVKRPSPGWALLAGLAVFAADMSLGGSIGGILVMFDLLYNVGRHGGPRLRRAVLSGIVVLAVAAGVAAAEQVRDIRAFVLTAVQVVALGAMPVWWASEVRRGDELAREADRRARLEAERADAVTRAAASERARLLREERGAMARDLHDLVSSHLSAIALQSGAALVAARDPERDREALAQVRAEAVASLTQMRAMVHLLRSDEDRSEWTTSPGLDALPDLVARMRDAGLAVAWAGDDVADALAVATAGRQDVGRAAYRIVHESLTNALRHGAGSAELALADTGGTIDVVVTNPVAGGRAPAGPDVVGPGGPAPAGDDEPLAPVSSGTGLLGMRERAEALGGTFDAGTETTADAESVDATWRVRASLPLREPTDEENR
jgi:signal transduction histidine kinase